MTGAERAELREIANAEMNAYANIDSCLKILDAQKKELPHIAAACDKLRQAYATQNRIRARIEALYTRKPKIQKGGIYAHRLAEPLAGVAAGVDAH